MRSLLIAGVLLVTGLTFFAASQSIDARTNEAIEQISAAADNNRRAEGIAALEEAKAKYSAEIASLETQYRDQAEQNGAMATALEQALSKIADTNAERLAAMQQNAELMAKLTAANSNTDHWDQQIAEAQGIISGLTQKLQDRGETVTALETKLKTVETQLANAQRVADTSAQRIAELENQTTSGEAGISTSELQVAALLLETKEQQAVAAAAQERVTSMEAELAYLERERMGLINGMKKRDAEIQELRASVVVPKDLTVASCTAETNALFADQKINFATGTDRVDESSADLLDRLAHVAFDCAHRNMTVTIGGHTDSQGTESNNQTLSERRAAAIRNFLGSRGLPSASMQAVGYGESQPIADNTTTEGRAENRRITFEWQESTGS